MIQYSYQLYSSRNFPPMSRTLAMVADAGYAQVEGYGGMFEDTASIAGLAQDLTGNGLTMPTVHLGLDAVQSDPQGVIEMAKTLGIQQVFVPHLAEEARPTDAAGWAEFARELDAAGAPLRAAGLGFGWHNHDFEFTAMADGTFPFDAMLQAAPALLIELDIAWVQVAGQDPVDWINRDADRIVACHVKDIAPEGTCLDEDGWEDVGHGVLDWSAINAALAGTAVKTRVMEHDNPSDDERFARRSISAAQNF
jgi:sugar phosphate isomerase/epimerase